jgi:hypothetical protein
MDDDLPLIYILAPSAELVDTIEALMMPKHFSNNHLVEYCDIR